MKMMTKLLSILGLLMIVACNDTGTSTDTAGTTVEVEERTDKKEEENTEKKKTILFFGDSLSAGYGVDAAEESFPGIISKRIDSLGLAYQVVNAGLSGETTAGGASRIDWILKQPIDIFILELGGNDGLRGIKPESSHENLQSIIDKTKAKYPDVKIIIAGMMAPPNMGPDFTENFRNIFPTIAQKNNAALIPFLLDKVGGIPELNQADGIHPTPEGHLIVAENVWKVLEGML